MIYMLYQFSSDMEYTRTATKSCLTYRGFYYFFICIFFFILNEILLIIGSNMIDSKYFQWILGFKKCLFTFYTTRKVLFSRFFNIPQKRDLALPNKCKCIFHVFIEDRVDKIGVVYLIHCNLDVETKNFLKQNNISNKIVYR